jgi:hypothetical protein
MTGTYPTRAQLLRFAGVADQPEVVPAGVAELGLADSEGSCCGGTNCC